MHFSTYLVLFGLLMCQTALAQHTPYISSQEVESPFYFAVKVDDMERSVAWYQAVLDVEVLDETWIRNDSIGIVNLLNEHVMIELIYDARTSSYELDRGFFKVGFHVPDVEQVAERVARETSSRPRVVEDTPRGIRIVQLKDPDGNTIQLFTRD